jgi:L-threonylcarbamoyladenylate synthase
MKEFEKDIEACIEVLRHGGLILYPTDTIWGIGCDATNADAVQRVYQLKRRADNNGDKHERNGERTEAN